MRTPGHQDHREELFLQDVKISGLADRLHSEKSVIHSARVQAERSAVIFKTAAWRSLYIPSQIAYILGNRDAVRQGLCLLCLVRRTDQLYFGHRLSFR